MSTPPLPDIAANFTPVPHEFFSKVFNGQIESREELLVCLYSFHRTFGWQADQGSVSLNDICRDTILDTDLAEAGVAAALEHGILIRLSSVHESTDAMKSVFLLNTRKNRRFVDTYAAEDGNEGPALPPINRVHQDTAPVGENGEFVIESDGIELADGFQEEDFAGTIPIDMADDSSEEIPFEDEVFPADENEEDLPKVETGDFVVNDPDKSDEHLPFTPRTVEMLVRIIGRPLTKDEHERLLVINATDDELIRAMRSLLSKNRQIYSSDLVIYEFERIRTKERQQEKHRELQKTREIQAERQKKCKKCEGLGYVFVGANTIKECTCKKGVTE